MHTLQFLLTPIFSHLSLLGLLLNCLLPLRDIQMYAEIVFNKTQIKCLACLPEAWASLSWSVYRFFFVFFPFSQYFRIQSVWCYLQVCGCPYCRWALTAAMSWLTPSWWTALTAACSDPYRTAADNHLMCLCRQWPNVLWPPFSAISTSTRKPPCEWNWKITGQPQAWKKQKSVLLWQPWDWTWLPTVQWFMSEYQQDLNNGIQAGMARGYRA